MASSFIVVIFLLSLGLVPAFAVDGSWFIIPALASVAVSGHLIFSNSMNLVQYVGRFYWIIRDNVTPSTPRIAKAFMRQYTYPYLFGTGTQVRFRRWTVQFGLCRRNPFGDEIEGLVNAIGGRYMEDSPKDIGFWT